MSSLAPLRPIAGPATPTETGDSTQLGKIVSNLFTTPDDVVGSPEKRAMTYKKMNR
jgi:hypothetical protein